MLEEPPKFECSNKTYKYREKNTKGRNSFRPIKNIIIKINIRESFSKEINLKENLKQMHLKSVNVGHIMKKYIMQMNALKRKKQTSMN